MNNSENVAYYLYGFGRCSDLLPSLFPSLLGSVDQSSPNAAALPPSTSSEGVDERYAPFLWHHANSAAILSLAAKDDFCGPSGDSHLRDVAWLAPRVCRHERVLEQAMRFSPILPARFGTLFSSLAALDVFMERHQQTIARYFQKTSGQQEWALKGFLDRTQAEEELRRRLQAEQKTPLPPSPGLAFLQDQKWRLKAREELEIQLANACAELLEDLTPLASETCHRKVLSQSETGADQEMILNWAFLVPQPAAADFQKQAQEAGSRTLPGLKLAITGPWPPYSFCPILGSETDNLPLERAILRENDSSP